MAFYAGRLLPTGMARQTRAGGLATGFAMDSK